MGTTLSFALSIRLRKTIYTLVKFYSLAILLEESDSIVSKVSSESPPEKLYLQARTHESSFQHTKTDKGDKVLSSFLHLKKNYCLFYSDKIRLIIC